MLAPEGGFEQAWARRHELHGGAVPAAWDRRDPGSERAGAHKWVTLDPVLAECLIAPPASGVRLGEPAVLLAGDGGLPERLPRRPPVSRAETAGRPPAHPVERAYDDFTAAARATRAGD